MGVRIFVRSISTERASKVEVEALVGVRVADFGVDDECAAAFDRKQLILAFVWGLEYRIKSTPLILSNNLRASQFVA